MLQAAKPALPASACRKISPAYPSPTAPQHEPASDFCSQTAPIFWIPKVLLAGFKESSLCDVFSYPDAHTLLQEVCLLITGGKRGSIFIHRDMRLTTSKNSYDNYGQALQNSFTNIYFVVVWDFFPLFLLKLCTEVLNISIQYF